MALISLQKAQQSFYQAAERREDRMSNLNLVGR